MKPLSIAATFLALSAGAVNPGLGNPGVGKPVVGKSGVGPKVPGSRALINDPHDPPKLDKFNRDALGLNKTKPVSSSQSCSGGVCKFTP